MLSKFEELLQEASNDYAKVWDLIKFMCNAEYGPNFTFGMGRNFDGGGDYYAWFGDFKVTSNNPVMAVLKAAIAAMED